MPAPAAAAENGAPRTELQELQLKAGQVTDEVQTDEKCGCRQSGAKVTMTVKYNASDKERFLQIIGRYSIIEDRRTDAYTIEKKRNAWEQVTLAYNAVTVEKRTVIQLKRLWDKIKRSRKSALAEVRREMMATEVEPPKLPPSTRPEIDNLVPHLHFEIDVPDDSNGNNLQNTAEGIYIKLEDIEDATPGPSSTPEVSSVTDESSFRRKEIKKTVRSKKTSSLDEITKARLELIKKEAEQLEELHRVRLEEAQYRRETARLQMLEQEAKFKRFQEELNKK